MAMKAAAMMALLVGLWSGGAAMGQSGNSDVHQSTTAPTDARFEVVQSEIAAKWTFLLDRFTGHVWQLVVTANNGNAWESVRIIGLPTIAAPSAPRFQIFESGIAAKFQFLLDTVSGKTWTLITQKNRDGSSDGLIWEPFEQ
jgi:hypothetical protein